MSILIPLCFYELLAFYDSIKCHFLVKIVDSIQSTYEFALLHWHVSIFALAQLNSKLFIVSAHKRKFWNQLAVAGKRWRWSSLYPRRCRCYILNSCSLYPRIDPIDSSSTASTRVTLVSWPVGDSFSFCLINSSISFFCLSSLLLMRGFDHFSKVIQLFSPRVASIGGSIAWTVHIFLDIFCTVTSGVPTGWVCAAVALAFVSRLILLYFRAIRFVKNSGLPILDSALMGSYCGCCGLNGDLFAILY